MKPIHTGKNGGVVINILSLMNIQWFKRTEKRTQANHRKE